MFIKNKWNKAVCAERSGLVGVIAVFLP
jgi:hypothetical protein